jgi:hypothetical protein
MSVPIEYTQTRAYNINKGSMNLIKFYSHGDKYEQRCW